VIAEGVGRFAPRFRVGDEWKSEFDSAAAGALPAAVELAVWYGIEPIGPPDRTRIVAVPDAGRAEVTP